VNENPNHDVREGRHMPDPTSLVDPALAQRLPGVMVRLLERCVPHHPDCPTYNRGILAGLRFALRLLRSAPCSTEQAQDALSGAVAIVQARLKPQEDEEERAFLAKYKADHSQPTAEELEFWNNLDKHEWIPVEQLQEELEELIRRDAEPEELERGWMQQIKDEEEKLLRRLEGEDPGPRNGAAP
jgi:hypothetical protein